MFQCCRSLQKGANVSALLSFVAAPTVFVMLLEELIDV